MDEVAEADTSSEAVAINTARLRELPLVFRATGGEYFRIWIVNLLLTILTLGIFSAWAKVRRLRYFYGSTSLEGSSFEYHGKPIAILKGRLIVVGIYAVFLVTAQFWPVVNIVLPVVAIFGVPWVIARSRYFRMRMTSWRGLRFNFHGRTGGAMKAFVGWPLLSMVSAFALWPLMLWQQAKYIIGHTSFGSQRFEFTTSIGRFYRFCLITLGVALGAAVCAGLAVAAVRGLVGLDAVSGLSPDARRNAAAAIGGATALVTLGLASLVAGAWYRALFFNATIGGTAAGPHRLVARLRPVTLLGITVGNLLAMAVTLGLYYPWAKVRLLRYQLDNTKVLVAGDLSQLLADASADGSAVGEEAGDFFDVDFGI